MTRVAAPSGRWAHLVAHFDFTRMNIELTSLQNQIEDHRGILGSERSVRTTLATGSDLKHL